jgi:PIN domain nuclease of toxin-antitoxin system
MRLLLDTHIALWAISANPRLGKRTAELIRSADGVYVSAASIWEIAIKHRISNVRMPISGSAAISEFRAAGFELLAISAEHAAAVDALPPLHHDPFDRILIAQALAEPLRLLTHDATLERYSDIVLRA